MAPVVASWTSSHTSPHGHDILGVCRGLHRAYDPSRLWRTHGRGSYNTEIPKESSQIRFASAPPGGFGPALTPVLLFPSRWVVNVD